jgi:hypothetical protein
MLKKNIIYEMKVKIEDINKEMKRIIKNTKMKNEKEINKMMKEIEDIKFFIEYNYAKIKFEEMKNDEVINDYMIMDMIINYK